MADLRVDVDTAVVVPVNIMPLLDDTTFKTIETAVVYNSGGMALQWNFVTPAGAYTSTAVTPTTGGNYDWAEPLADVGMYSIEIPASGGATINNDTEGCGWFTGIATGVLPWRGPTIEFASALVNDALTGTDRLQVHVAEMTNDIITAASIADDAIAAEHIADDAIVAATFATDCITDDAIATGAIASTAFAAGAINAAAIADAAIDNATFAADVGSTAYATNIIALAADKAVVNAALATSAELAKVPKSDSTVTWNDTAKATIQTECNDALIANNLDHLALTATSGVDMTTEVADGTVLSRIISSTSDTSTYLPSTDSLEAVRDRGDLAWATGSGAGANLAYAPSAAPTITTKHADAVVGTYNDLATVNASGGPPPDTGVFSIREVATTNPPLDFYFPFECAIGVFPSTFDVWGYYSGNSTHWMRVQAAVGGVVTAWEDIGTMPNANTITRYSFKLTPQHINPTTGAAYIRFLHNGVAGSASHYLYLDKLLFTAQSIPADNEDLALALKLLRNKVVTDPAAGTITVYDDNGSSILYVANVWEDVAGSVPFDGTGANRRDRLEEPA